MRSSVVAYTQVLDGFVREAVDRVGGELFTAIKAGGKLVTIVHKPGKSEEVSVG